MNKSSLNRVLCLLLSLSLSFSVFAQPANDLCASATVRVATTGCTNTAGTLYLATSTGSPTSTWGPTYDVWYTTTVPASVNTLRIQVTGNGSSINNNNTFIEVFRATACGSVTTANSIGTASIATNPPSNSNSGITLFNLSPSTVYYFRVFTTTNPNTGVVGNWNFNVCVSHSTTVPTNNECGNAVVLTPGTSTAGTIANATASVGIPVGCATGTPDDDIWYSFTAVRTFATVTVKAAPAFNDSKPMIQVFSGACGSLVSLACGQDAVNLTGLTTGQIYRIRVYSFGATGAGAIARPYNGLGVDLGTTFNISVTPALETTIVAGRMNEVYQYTNLSSQQIVADPWEITYGPDNFLWITEAKGYRVFRMDPTTGARTTVLDVSKGSTFLSLADTSFNLRHEIAINNPQGGLAGLAIHPNFLHATTPINFVYLSYIYKYDHSVNGNYYTNRLVRFTYNTGTGKLESPVSLCDTLPGSNDHNSQRMIIVPVGGTNYLFYASGDMGSGQFANQNRPMKAQDSTSYEGKTLRFNLESDGDAGLLDRWIPNNNPYNATLGVQSAVWNIGMRNNQGFAYDAERDILYGSSHGPYSDDEVNIIDRYKNYGHPLVIGLASDNNYANCSAGTTNAVSSCPVISSEITNRNTINASGFAPYQDPIFTAYASSPTITNIYTQIWSLTTPPGIAGWPSEGWSGLDIYKSTLIPGWKNSLVAASLKWGRLLKIKLGAGGTSTLPVSDTVSYFGGQNRFRDIAFNPNGKDVYVVMDRSTTSSGPSNANPVVPACAGCIQKYTFLGYADNGSKSSIPTSIDVTDGTVNQCNTGTTITIDNDNNNLWVPITGSDGNIMAEIFSNGQNLGVVTSSFYKHGGAIRVRNGSRYLDRNIAITPQTQPITPVKIRLYLSKAEFDALDADPLSGITTINDLKILKNNDACASSVLTNTTLINPTFSETHGAQGYMLQASISSFSSFYLGSSTITLPLNLLTFMGTLQNDNSVLLKWKTENEINTSYFEVERSLDGIRFSTIANVTAAGNSLAVSNYTNLDINAINQPSPVLYYRLKMVDVDGGYSFSNIAVVNLNTVTRRMTALPNPAKSIVNINLQSGVSEKANWKLLDNAGRVVMQNTIQLLKGNNNWPIDVNRLTPGIYYLHISGVLIDQRIKIQKH